MVDGWLDWCIKDPGPANRTNGGKNTHKGVVIHSAEGYWPQLRVVLWGDRGSSWMFSNLKDGRCFQHYPIWAQTWTSGAGYPNNNCVAWENEGVAGQPFTDKQNDNNLKIIETVRELGKWNDTRRPINSSDKGAQLWEHNEMTRFGAEPTACPSGRVPWGLYLARLKEEDMAISLAAVADSPTGYRLYALGSGDPKWVTSAAASKDLIDAYGQPKALDWATLQVLGAK